MPVKNSIAELLPEMTAWRHDFHANPELMYDVQRTAGKVAALLRGFGCDEVVEGIGRTGVVGIIKGRKETSGRAIGLRADMDALPIHEQTGMDYASQIAGKMHACGHDGHTTMLLGAAHYLCQTRNFNGRVVLIFQPAEEGGAGGRAMVEDGLISRFGITEVYAMHNMPGLEVGHFAIRSGPIWAAADEFTLTITGKGGHAAMPHNGVDAMVIAAQIITAAQTIVARNVDPIKQAVVSICTIASDSPAHNVLPQTVTMKGTARSFDPEIRSLLEDRLRTLSTHVATALGGQAVLDFRRGYPPTINAAQETEFAIAAARAVSDHVDTQIDPLMGGEDFSFMLNACPGAYILTGNGESAALHHPAYNFNDTALPHGATWYAQLAEMRLAF